LINQTTNNTINNANPKDASENNMEHIKYLENIIFNLRNDLKKCKYQNKEIREENSILKHQLLRNGIDNVVIERQENEFSRAPQHYLTSSNQKYTKLDYRGSQSIKRNTPNNEIDDTEEMDSFLLAEQIANDEVMQNPFNNPIVELMSLKTQGNIYNAYNVDINSLERRKRSINFRSNLKPRIQLQDNPSKTFDDFKNVTPNAHRKANLDGNGMFGFDNEEPTPLPKQVPYFVGEKKFGHKTERKGLHKKEQVKNDEKYIRRVKGKFKPADLVDKNKLENN
jgi:hypothetical protein